jgi:hypothetical protein
MSDIFMRHLLPAPQILISCEILGKVIVSLVIFELIFSVITVSFNRSRPDKMYYIYTYLPYFGKL